MYSGLLVCKNEQNRKSSIFLDASVVLPTLNVSSLSGLLLGLIDLLSHPFLHPCCQPAVQDFTCH